jgi:hypothetical protein
MNAAMSRLSEKLVKVKFVLAKFSLKICRPDIQDITRFGRSLYAGLHGAQN